MNLTEVQMRYRRGLVLQILARSEPRGCGAPLLRQLLRERGYKADGDTFAIDLAWLKQHGLVSVRELAGVELVRISERGKDIASGDLEMPGVELLEIEP